LSKEKSNSDLLNDTFADLDETNPRADKIIATKTETRSDSSTIDGKLSKRRELDEYSKGKDENPNKSLESFLKSP